jgi:hypothetical protein
MAKPGLTPEQRQRIIRMRDANPKLRYKTLATKFGCSVAHIASIICGRASKPVETPKPRPQIRPNVMPGITLAQLTARR